MSVIIPNCSNFKVDFFIWTQWVLLCLYSNHPPSAGLSFSDTSPAFADAVYLVALSGAGIIKIFSGQSVKSTHPITVANAPDADLFAMSGDL